MEIECTTVESKLAFACIQAISSCGGRQAEKEEIVSEMARSGKLVASSRLNKLVDPDYSVMKNARSILGLSCDVTVHKSSLSTELKDYLHTSKLMNTEFDKELQVFALEFDKVRLASEAISLAKFALNEDDLKDRYQQLVDLGIITQPIRKQRRRESPIPSPMTAGQDKKPVRFAIPVSQEPKSEAATTEKLITENRSMFYLDSNASESRRLKQRKKEKIVKKMIGHIAQSNNVNDLMSIRDSLVDFTRSKIKKADSPKNSCARWTLQDISDLSQRLEDGEGTPHGRQSLRRDNFEKIPLLSNFEGSCSNFNQDDGSVLPEFSLMMGNSNFKF